MEILTKCGCSTRIVRLGWDHMILPGVEDPHNWVDPWNLGQSEWDQNLGKTECVLSNYDRMRWKWDDVYQLLGPPNIYSPSLSPTLLHLYLCKTTVYLWWCTWRTWSRVIGDALGDWDWVKLAMHLEARIERVWRCTWILRDRVNSEMNLEGVIERVGSYTWRPWLIMIGGVLGCGWSGCD